MSVPLPKAPSGNSPGAVWARQIMAYLQSIKPISGVNTEVSRTTRGTIITTKAGGGGSGKNCGQARYS